jgi:activator of HSP90 ATPase
MIKNIARIFVFLAALFFLQSSARAQAKQTAMSQPGVLKDTGNSIHIHQEADFKVGPEKLYQTLLDSKQFSEMTAKSGGFAGMSAKIDGTVGGLFSVFDGHIFGRIIELVPNQRIVEVWRVVDWPAGVYSVARFEFIPKGSGTHLVFDHTGFPEGLKEHLAMGWQQHYWDALTLYLTSD